MSITAYLKPTNRCNVGCSHCYLSLDVRHNSQIMTTETLKASIDVLAEMAERNSQSVHIAWHGGEPLVLPASWYLNAQPILKAGLDDFYQSFMTSLLPLRQEHLDLFEELELIQIGTSVDFSNRQIKGSSDAYLELLMRKVDMAREAGLFVAPTMVPSIHDLGNEKDIVEWFVDHDFPIINIDRYSSYGRTDPNRPTNAQHAKFLIDLTEAILQRLEKGLKTPFFPLIGAAVDGLLTGMPGERWGTTCQSHFLVIEPNGSVNTCPDRATFEPAHSNVLDGFNAVTGSLLMRKWRRTQAVGHFSSNCHTCPHFKFCKSGCPITPHDTAEDGGECAGYASYLWYLDKALSNDPVKREQLIYYADIDKNETVKAVKTSGVAA
ncbi:radical SAM protein [Pseudovibrio ascidiaceicola]|uniref:radical SAM protein n=1 Tax=Pseudovibrio ascidiaceicola TaxID=285279 RepID=UPI003D3600F3